MPTGKEYIVEEHAPGRSSRHPCTIMAVMYEFDIALSFAGEQRTQVLEVAECLKASGVKVFYDSYERSTLWGRDLYQHLSEVYRKRAKYCIVFASKDYALKAWTNHELKSAQARAFEDKGQEYILPVRFDSTDIPGILPTTGYLDFATEGVSGICEAALSKLALTAVSSGKGNELVTCDSSPRAYLRSNELGMILFPKILECSWAKTIEFTVRCEDAETDALLARFRDLSGDVACAFGFDVAVARVSSAVRSTVSGISKWTLGFHIETDRFSNAHEMGTTTISADQFAEMRARRLLLNENPFKPFDDSDDVLTIANKSMNENLIRGLTSIVQVERSSYPKLYEELGSNPQHFIEAAWIITVAELKLSATIGHIEHLRLALDERLLHVNFRGRRYRVYENVDPHVIDILGQLSLSPATSS